MNQTESRRRQLIAFTDVLLLVIWFTVGRMIGENGITYVAIALAVSSIAGAFVSGGVTDALGRLLRSRKNKGQYKNALRLKKYALIMQASVALAGALLLFFTAQVIAEDLLQVKYCAIIIRMFAPFLLFRTITGVLLGFFQGEGQELPLVGAGVLRAFFTLVFSYLFMGKLGSYGEKVSVLLQQPDFAAMYEGLAVAVAVCIAELLCGILLAVLYRVTRPGRETKQEGLRTTDTWTDCAAYLTKNRIHAMLSEILLCVSLLAGVLFWNKVEVEGVSLTAVYGVYVGKYLTVCIAVVLCLYAFATPVLSKTFACIKKEDKRYARMIFQSGIHACAVQGIFFSVFIAVMAEQIAAVLVKEDAAMLSSVPTVSNTELMTEMFRMGSALIGLGGLVLYFFCFLQATGKRYIVTGTTAIAVVIYGVYLFIMSKVENVNVMSPVYGGMICLLIVCVLLGVMSYRFFRTRMDWLKILVIPLGVSCVIGLLCMMMAKVFTPHLGNGFTLLIVFIPAIFLYWVLLLLLRNFREQELDVIVGGRLIAALGQLLRVY